MEPRIRGSLINFEVQRELTETLAKLKKKKKKAACVGVCLCVCVCMSERKRREIF